MPEAALIVENAKYFYEVIAHGGIGFSPFGIDDNSNQTSSDKLAEQIASFGQEYKAAAPMMRELAQWAFDGKINAVVEHEDHAEQTINLGAWQAIISFGIMKNNNVTTTTLPLGKIMTAN